MSENALSNRKEKLATFFPCKKRHLIQTVPRLSLAAVALLTSVALLMPACSPPGHTRTVAQPFREENVQPTGKDFLKWFDRYRQGKIDERGLLVKCLKEAGSIRQSIDGCASLKEKAEISKIYISQLQEMFIKGVTCENALTWVDMYIQMRKDRREKLAKCLKEAGSIRQSIDGCTSLLEDEEGETLSQLQLEIMKECSGGQPKENIITVVLRETPG